MPLQFVGDAIALSGEYGSKRKTEIISDYYRFWLGVVARHQYVRSVNIIEMDAGTGELYFKDIRMTALGSAGHSLNLRYNSKDSFTRKLQIFLVEEDNECRNHMLKVIQRRWPKAALVNRTHNSLTSKDEHVVLFENTMDFLNETDDGQIPGMSLFYFDPLLSVDWALLDKIAAARIIKPYKTGTEFLVFFFTSDWITGRSDPYFHSLPQSDDEPSWTDEEKVSADIADRSFGGREWLQILSSSDTKKNMEEALVRLYKRKLRKWFRFIVPLPFVPKKGQIYHVFCCSNYDVGVGVIHSIYAKYMQPYGLSATNPDIYREFKNQHRSLEAKYSGNKKSPEWKVLWHVMRNCPDGLCDSECENLQTIAGGAQELERAIKWLRKHDYLRRIKIREWPWNAPKYPIYKIRWDTAEANLKIERPIPPKPLEPP
jgi:three-Cys-motif partner protein